MERACTNKRDSPSAHDLPTTTTNMPRCVVVGISHTCTVCTRTRVPSSVACQIEILPRTRN